MRNFDSSTLRWSTICGLTGLAVFVWFGPSRDSLSEDPQSRTEFAMNAPGAFARLRTPHSMIDIRYAYPAVDPFVVPEDFYF